MTTANIIPVNVGLAPNDGLGDPLRTSFQLLNQDVQQLSNRVQTTLPGGGNTANLAGAPGDQVGWITFDPNHLYYCWGNYANAGGSNIWNQVDIAGNASTLSNGTSNVSIPVANSSVTVYAGGNLVANFVPSDITGNTTAEFSGNVRIAGNLNVIGNINYSNTTQTVTTDPIIELAANNVSDFIDIGFVGQFVTGNTGNQYTGLIRQASSGTYKLFSNIFVEPANTIDFTNAVYNTLQVGNLESGAGNINTTGNVNAGNVVVSGQVNATGNSSAANYSTTGNVNANNVSVTNDINVVGRANVTGNITTVANVSGTFILGNGIFLTGVYNNSSAQVYLANLTSNVTTTANVQAEAVIANLFVGPAIVANSANINGNAFVTGNVTANYFLGNGQFLTGVISDYNNSNVANYLPTYTGNLVSLTGNVTTTANVNANGLSVARATVTGNATLENIIANTLSTSGLANVNALIAIDSTTTNVANVVTLNATGNISGDELYIAGNIDVGGNIGNSNPLTAANSYIFGNGFFISGLPFNFYGNADVANYLPTYTGNLVSLQGDVITLANIRAGNANIINNVAVTNINAVDVFASANITSNANINGAFINGNIANATGGYSNVDVASFLGSNANIELFFNGNLTMSGVDANIQLVGDVVASEIYADGNSATSNIGFISTTGNIFANQNIEANNQLSGNTLFVPGSANIVGVTIGGASNITTTGNIQANYYTGNGGLLTGLYSNANVLSYGETGWAGNIVPNANAVYSLGNSTNYWSNLWVAGNTLYLGGVPLGMAGGNVLTVNGNAVLIDTGNTNVAGNLRANNISANTLAVSGQANVGPLTANGNISGGNISATGNLSGVGLTLTGNISSQVTYGSFYSNVTQTNSNVGNPIPITYNNTYISNGVVIQSGANIVIRKSGVYNIQFSIQLEKSDLGSDDVYLWLDKNGNTVANTATIVTLSGGGAREVAAWNFVVDAAANDYFRLIWLSNDTNAFLAYDAPTGAIPAIPSVILTVVPVGP